MTLQDFKSLSQIDQYQIIRRSGAYLGERWLGAHRAELYQVESFYLEVFYSRRSNDIAWMRIFDNTDQLEPYLANLDVLGLFY